MTTLTEQFLDKEVMEGFCWPYVIAGGCLRDGFFNKPINDMDVFIAIPKRRLKSIKKKGEFWLHFDTAGRPSSVWSDSENSGAVIKFVIDGEEEYELDEFISGRSDECPGLNIILREYNDSWAGVDEIKEFAEELIAGFPCSISQIAWDTLHDRWFFSESFKDSLLSGVVYFPPNITMKYMGKIFPKYYDIFTYGYRDTL